MASFGKDQELVNKAISFRQQAQLQKDSTAKPQNTKGRVPYYMNQFKPSTEHKDKLRIIPGNYEIVMPETDVFGGQGSPNSVTSTMNFFTAIEHYNGTTKRGFICSGGPFHSYAQYASPCKGCDVYRASKPSKKTHISKRNLYIVSVLRFGEFAAVPVKDKRTGQLLVNPRTDKPYFNWEVVTRQNKESFRDYEKRAWLKQPWAMSFTHWNTILGYAQNISNSCSSCGGKNSIEAEAYVCKHCGEALIEMSSTTMSDKEINEMLLKPVTCPHCNEKDFLEDVITCSKCSNPVRAEIFDVDLTVYGVLDTSNPEVTKTNLILDYEAPSKLDAVYLTPSEEYETPIFSPLPLERQYAPLDYSEQDDFVTTEFSPNRASATKSYKK